MKYLTKLSHHFCPIKYWSWSDHAVAIVIRWSVAGGNEGAAEVVKHARRPADDAAQPQPQRYCLLQIYLLLITKRKSIIWDHFFYTKGSYAVLLTPFLLSHHLIQWSLLDSSVGPVKIGLIYSSSITSLLSIYLDLTQWHCCQSESAFFEVLYLYPGFSVWYPFSPYTWCIFKIPPAIEALIETPPPTTATVVPAIIAPDRRPPLRTVPATAATEPAIIVPVFKACMSLPTSTLQIS